MTMHKVKVAHCPKCTGVVMKAVFPLPKGSESQQEYDSEKKLQDAEFTDLFDKGCTLSLEDSSTKIEWCKNSLCR